MHSSSYLPVTEVIIHSLYLYSLPHSNTISLSPYFFPFRQPSHIPSHHPYFSHQISNPTLLTSALKSHFSSQFIPIHLSPNILISLISHLTSHVNNPIISPYFTLHTSYIFPVLLNCSPLTSPPYLPLLFLPSSHLLPILHLLAPLPITSSPLTSSFLISPLSRLQLDPYFSPYDFPSHLYIPVLMTAYNAL